jgi:hypothetical protein|tara:strand:+ start:470 stop:709 length:240 start_codon:yes stop_codon:yes gene_type:complete
MKKIIIENQVSSKEQDKRTWEKRIANVIKARKNSKKGVNLTTIHEDGKKHTENVSFYNTWDIVLKELLRKAKKETLLIN